MIPVAEENDPDLRSGELERCCFCRSRTRHWTKLLGREPGQQVACCEKCAAIALPQDVPTKSDWCEREKVVRLAGVKQIMDASTKLAHLRNGTFADTQQVVDIFARMRALLSKYPRHGMLALLELRDYAQDPESRLTDAARELLSLEGLLAPSEVLENSTTANVALSAVRGRGCAAELVDPVQHTSSRLPQSVALDAAKREPRAGIIWPPLITLDQTEKLLLQLWDKTDATPSGKEKEKVIFWFVSAAGDHFKVTVEPQPTEPQGGEEK